MTEGGASPGATRWIRLRNIALEYVGIGWFLTQVLGVLGRQLGWPAQVSDWLVIGLGAGFVATLTLAMLMMRRGRPGVKRRRGLWIAAVAGAGALVLWLWSGGLSGLRTGPSGVVAERRGLFSGAASAEGFFVVHPQDPLVSTGVLVGQGQTVSAWGEGRVNLALANLVEAVESGDPGAYEWLGPEGEVDARGQPMLRQDRGRAGRQRCLVHPSFPYGALLLVIAPSDPITPATVRALDPGREVFAVGARLETRAQVGGYLALGVNDVYLDREECDPEAFAAGLEPGAFFRDNIGFFTARIDVR